MIQNHQIEIQWSDVIVKIEKRKTCILKLFKINRPCHRLKQTMTSNCFSEKKKCNNILYSTCIFFLSRNTLHVFVLQIMLVQFVVGHTRPFTCVASGSRFVAFSALVSAPRSILNKQWRPDRSQSQLCDARTEAHTLCMDAESGIQASPPSSFLYSYIKKQQQLCLLGPWNWFHARAALLRTEVTSIEIDEAAKIRERSMSTHTPLLLLPAGPVVLLSWITYSVLNNTICQPTSLLLADVRALKLCTWTSYA